jgi:predicted glycosyltransferase involved in capsule biosynthesis
MKLGVCVPYRNREEHLAQFSPRVHKFLEERGIEHKIYFAHQCDNLLFNRGKMKNIAADIAFKDGCDYIVWHDIDMIPEDDSCDYSYNPENPKHLAVRISQTDYNLKYEEYFGGAVLFTKEQVMKTNGYSNDYWDWGMEDDDLFWRCALNGMADQTYIKPQNELNPI